MKTFLKFFGVTLLILALCMIIYFVVENPLSISDVIRQNIFYIVVTAIFVYILTYDALKFLANLPTTKNFLFGVLLVGAFISTPLLVSSNFLYPEYNFWFCLMDWLALYILYSYEKIKEEITFEKFMLLLSSIFTISSLYITLGHTLFDYSAPTVKKIWQISPLLDIRLNILILIVGVGLIRSISEVLHKEKFDVLPQFENGDMVLFGRRFGQSMFPIIRDSANSIIQMVKKIGLGFKYVGKEMARLFKSIAQKSVQVLLYSIAFLLVILSLATINFLSRHLVHYYEDNRFLEAIYPSLIYTIGCSIFLIFLIIAINALFATEYKHAENKFVYLKDNFETIQKRATSTGEYLALMLWASGLILLVVSHYKNFKTFKIPGLIIGLFTFLFLLYFVQDIFRRRKKELVVDNENEESNVDPS